MAEESVLVEAVSVVDLKAEVQSRISQMQSCCLWLRFSSVKCRCQILGSALLLLVLFPVVMELVYGPDAGAAAAACFLLFPLLLYALCVKLPRSGRLVSDLRRQSEEMKDLTAALKRRVDDEVWFRSMSSRWSSVQELEKAGADIHGYVETMGSVVNIFLISKLKTRLKESQRHLNNI